MKQGLEVFHLCIMLPTEVSGPSNASQSLSLPRKLTSKFGRPLSSSAIIMRVAFSLKLQGKVDAALSRADRPAFRFNLLERFLNFREIHTSKRNDPPIKIEPER